MTDLDNTKDLVSTLFKSGLTDNEKLQKLLWNLKEIAELSNEDLGINGNDDLKVFFIYYLTDLANQYRPTNSSKLPEKILSIDNCFNDISIGVSIAFDRFLKSMPSSPNDEENHRLAHECLSEIRNRCNEEAQKIREITDKWLLEIRY
jgi:hypothetical protein